MRRFISMLCICAMLCVMAAPAIAEQPEQRGRHNHPPGQLMSDPRSGRSSFTAINGFTIESQLQGRKMSVVITDDLGNTSVRFEVDPPRHGVRDSEFKMEVGGASFIHRFGVEGEPGELEISKPGRIARFSDQRHFPGGQEDTEQAALAFYSLLEEVLTEQADYTFWQGVAVLAEELNAESVTQTSCVLGCLGCVAAILAHLAFIGSLIIVCNIAAPACIVALLAHLAGNFTLMAACGSCLLCIDQSGEEQDQAGTGTLTPNVQM
jgi:hypothetical protein